MTLRAGKRWLGGGGLAVGLAGMALREQWLVLCAVALLAGAFVLKLVERRRAWRADP